jgi:glutamate--cysteine ligase
MSSQVPINEEPIKNLEQLADYILQGAKPEERWLVGTEHEKFGWSSASQKHPSYLGEQGIEALLLKFEANGWQSTREGQDIIALAKNKATLTLEPGGQFELSGAPLSSLTALDQEIKAHFDELAIYSKELDLSWHGFGVTPFFKSSDIPRMPKARYGIMRKYLPTVGRLANEMMHNTCTVQANLDFKNEADAMKKLRVGLFLQPVVMAMFANSPAYEGALTGGYCMRGAIWQETDVQRYLYPAHFLAPNQSIMDYVKWALKVNLFFIVRDHQYQDCSGLLFNDFLEHGWQGHQATVGDFALHLSTLFPDVRLKQYLEVRGADMSSIDYMKALPAFHIGILYDDQAMDEVLSLFKDVSADELWTCRKSVNLQGLQTKLKNASLQTWATQLLKISRAGLIRRNERAEFLDPLEEQILAGKVPADRIIEAWHKGKEAVLEATRLM